MPRYTKTSRRLQARQLKQTRTERFILDEKLGKAYSVDEVLRVFDCAIACINDLPEARPSMGQVLRMLEGVGPTPPVPPAAQPSTVFGTNTDVSMVIPMTMTEGR
ncbi:hypothetical protein KFL_002650140 [Klebsormidium nitens]|uniref:Uncharacterized protein n=1 Tax=Klebsormidium nitens TaxID=105231 RepID=A0A1Y1ID57_KLENI|nr:hypothetical protein KFL_002650140 [Klebsormidium nitens]|eukprot:GAQ86018.1 hypothetical protein KFL_002650140 [Klebsormidium nitens]